MSSFVRDMLQVNQLEREIKRPLTEEELQDILDNEPIQLTKPCGRTFWTHVFLYEMPGDLLCDFVDLLNFNYGNKLRYSEDIDPEDEIFETEAPRTAEQEDVNWLLGGKGA